MSYDVKELDRLRSAGHSWADIAKQFPGVPLGTLSSALSRYRAQSLGEQDLADRERWAEQLDNQLAFPLGEDTEPADEPRPVYKDPGVRWGQAGTIDEREVWARALSVSKAIKARKEHRNSQTITFERGPICIVNFADLHLGGVGVDYERLSADLDLVMSTPGMYAGLAGDLVDNFIIGRLMALRMSTPFTVDEEWALVRYALRKIAPVMIWSVGGNHDKWTNLVSGVDYFEEVQQQIRPNVLYHSDELLVSVTVGQAEFKWRIRHKWQGRSQYSPTHGIERAAKFDKGKEFDIGIGGHTHESGVSRFFNNGGKTGLAVLVGSYKRIDTYAATHGFPTPNEVTAVPVILDEDGSILTTNTLEAAARYLRRMYNDRS